MKRNPVYSPRAKSEQNGYHKLKFTFCNGFGEVDSHGDVLMLLLKPKPNKTGLTASFRLRMLNW